jgi:PKD repeat protein
MRIAMKYNAIPSPCETFGYGEVEDYLVSFGLPQPPVADFSANMTTVIEGQSVQFTDLSTNGPSSWAWIFEGGTPAESNSQNPYITYNTAGTYTVSLIASNTGGYDEETKNQFINVVAVPACTSPVSPVDGATGTSVSANLEWNSVADATGYILYFGTNNPPSNLINGANLGNVTSFDPASDLNYTTAYYWKVVPYDDNGSPIGCPVWSFTTESSPFTPVQLSFSDFEAGWGIWTDGGIDCSRYTGGTYASGGVASIDIQHNESTASSFYLTNGVDVHTPGYVQLDVQFEFIAVGMSNNKDFKVQYYNGSTWYTVATYIIPTNFNNGIFYVANVSILESDFIFPTNMKIRFMCNGNNNNNDVYIDNVRITASTQANPNNYIVPLAGPQKELDGLAGNENDQVRVYPNPAHDQLNISIKDNKLAEFYIYDMKGQVVHHEIMNTEQQAISLDKFSNGVYMVYIITQETTFNAKFIKN